MAQPVTLRAMAATLERLANAELLRHLDGEAAAQGGRVVMPAEAAARLGSDPLDAITVARADLYGVTMQPFSALDLLGVVQAQVTRSSAGSAGPLTTLCALAADAAELARPLDRTEFYADTSGPEFGAISLRVLHAYLQRHVGQPAAPAAAAPALVPVAAALATVGAAGRHDRHVGSVAELQALLGGAKPVYVALSTSWCVKCKGMGSTIKKLHQAVGDKAEFVKVDYEEEAQVAAALQPLMDAEVTGFPTYLVFHRGKQVGRCGGDKAALARLLASATGADAQALRRAVGLR